MGTEGEGIGKIQGYTLFVKDAMTGDRVRVRVIKTKKHFGYARLLEILSPSPDRVKPLCPVARQCGGCQLQHCSYPSQLRWKENKVRDCLNRIGGFHVLASGVSAQISENVSEKASEAVPDAMSKKVSETSSETGFSSLHNTVKMEPILSMETPYYYRNKAQFPVGKDKNGRLVAGFYAGRTHSIIENTDCMIQHPCNRLIVETVLAFMQENHITPYDEKTHSGLVRHILTRVGIFTGEIMVCLVINGHDLPESPKLVDKLLHCDFGASLSQQAVSPENGQSAAWQEQAPLRIESICLNENTEKTNVILGSKISVLYGRNRIEDRIGSIKYQISPLSFYQVNPLQTRRLYETALEFADLKGGEIVWDLYCGIGTISLFLAQKAAKVCGVEIVPQAVEDARKNAALNQLENTEFFAGAAEQVVPEQYEKSGGAMKADVVTLDPPRKGCDEKLLDTVVKMNPEKIVYVSCDPATLARDLRYLCDRGYELRRVRACDMFGMSWHVETIVLMSRGKLS
ncbi:MAG: 23S rRNA (uracil(1939)-C(5))-methyltransferase RlmD [Clostridiaceae bacterium]|nr:23S rRNA (uracil(1939)-C(5))-methyltransferase RlmD [Clostridiaceae bacterium]